jgi:hypothetical protein
VNTIYIGLVSIQAGKTLLQHPYWMMTMNTSHSNYHQPNTTIASKRSCVFFSVPFVRNAGVSDWLLESPTMKTHSAAATLSCIQRTFASNHLHQSFNINSTRKTKHMRWKVYIHRLKPFIKLASQCLVTTPVILSLRMEGGKFNASSPWYKPSPTMSSYFANRLKKEHNATVLNIWN